MEYYTYAYLRKDGTPYYIGKGKGDRWSQKQRHSVKIPPKNRILILKINLTEEEAFKHEKYMISVFGRKDLGTGILRNMTNGGEGVSGYKHTDEVKIKISKANKGRKWSDSSKKNFSRKCIGRKPALISEEAKKRMSDARKGVSRPRDVIERATETRKQRYKPENHGSSKKFIFTSPTGEKYEVFGRFKEFCEKNELSHWGMRNFIRTGKIVPGCKNWSVSRCD